MIVEREISWRPPLDAFAPLALSRDAMVLHSGDAAHEAQWSFVLAHAARRIECLGADVFLDGARVDLNPFEMLSTLHRRRRVIETPRCGAPFAGGLAGFAGYECGGLVEPAARGPASPYPLPDFFFAAFDAVAAFDRHCRRTFLIGRSEEAVERLGASLGDAAPSDPPVPAFCQLTSNFSSDAYRAMVAAAIEKIRRGDFFQANLSQRLSAHAARPCDPFHLFRALSLTSTASFGAFIGFPAAQILSLSPERFFSVRTLASGALRICAEPIKGTRPRGETPADDAQLLQSLLNDAKDRAENIMIADLVRNDLSRVCDDGSISEDAICEAVTHATVHHLVSRISGTLRQDVNAADALAALFPCGSVTGAPKVEAMKAIAAAEGEGRGPYCGAIGYIDDAGAADFSVAIRTAVAEPGRLSIPVGGGVTLRSDPRAEYDETLTKARQFLRPLGLENAAP